MQLISFKPQTVTVDAGTTVTWTQKDPGVHTVTSGTVEQSSGGVDKVPDGRFDSGELATGKTFTFTFDQPGTYPYFCAVHPATMRGEVRAG
jgi:plastocyanin